MVDHDKLIMSGRELDRAFDLLDRANEAVLPTAPQLMTKQCLLREARRAVDAAKAALAH